MTARQLDYIKSLVQQKDTTGLTVEQLTFLGRIVVAPLDGYTFEAASRTITALVALPNRDGTPVVAPTTTRVPDVSAGRYALVADDGTIKFYSVDKPTDGKWAGRTFVNAMGSDTRYPIRNRDSRDAILATIAEAPERAMRLYASELGRCGYCGRELTDETSRAAGIGPDCADRHGIDRSVWAEQAQREAAARVRGDSPDPHRGEPGHDDDPSEYSEPVVEPSSDHFVDQQRDLARVRRSPTMGWRERRAAVAEQQGTVVRERTGTSQLQSLPGTTWEDIFGGAS